MFATDRSKGVDSAEYQRVYATEARTPNQAIAKVRPLAEGRRLRAFLQRWLTTAGIADAAIGPQPGFAAFTGHKHTT